VSLDCVIYCAFYSICLGGCFCRTRCRYVITLEKTNVKCLAKYSVGWTGGIICWRHPGISGWSEWVVLYQWNLHEKFDASSSQFLVQDTSLWYTFLERVTLALVVPQGEDMAAAGLKYWLFNYSPYVCRYKVLGLCNFVCRDTHWANTEQCPHH